jgi:hypothetical protein
MTEPAKPSPNRDTDFDLEKYKQMLNDARYYDKAMWVIPTAASSLTFLA